eukprot:GEMP01000233.1.p2 GENE.GEMP01000233.1~~GEMP01000233.1.p2  ORF type:complete len:1094 (-),score=272.50 GEMP01000233.1:699-3980(-)
MEQFLDILKILTTATDKTIRNTAEASYNNAIQGSPNDVAMLLLQVLESEEPRAREVHDMAGVLLRRELDKEENENLFHRCDDQRKEIILVQVLNLFQNSNDDKIIAKHAANCIAPLADLLKHKISFWPSLMPTILHMAVGDNQKKLRALKVLPAIMEYDPIRSILALNKTDTMKIVASTLQDANAEIQAEACAVVCSIVEHWPKEEWAPFEASLGLMITVLENFAKNNKGDQIGTVMTAFNDLVVEETCFFKSEFNRLAQVLSQFCVAKEFLLEDSRRAAFEFLVAAAESKPKMCVKQCTEFAQMTLKIALGFMAEIVNDPDWSVRMDDEEADEDAAMVGVGMEGVDRLVSALTVERSQNALIGVIGEFVNQDQWQAKYAALTAIRQSIEYVQDNDIADQMAMLLAQYTEHPHVRVRYGAWHALSQMASDQQPRFQEEWHERLMPLLVRAMDDSENRVQQIALSFFAGFGEALDNTHMELYASGMMKKLVSKIQEVNPHRGVREEAVTSIAVIAGVVEKDFGQYYDGVMPMLQNFIANSTEMEGRLRGKAFECMSLLGIAVGKERFHSDAQRAMEAMINTSKNVDSSNIQSEYIHEAVVRICRCLKKDFKPLLQYCLPQVYSILKLEKINKSAVDENDEDDDAYFLLHSGTKVKVKTSEMEELAANMTQLLAFIEEMEEEFFPEVANCANLLLPYIVDPQGIHFNAEETRDLALQCWAQLIKSCMAAKSQEALNLASDLLRKVCDGVYTFFAKYIPDGVNDLEEIKINASGLARCLKSAEAKILNSDEIKKMCDLPLVLLKHTFETRELKLQKKKNEVDADDDDADEEGDEHEAQLQLGELIGSLMFSSPAVFEQTALEPIGALLKMLFESTNKRTKEEDLALALYITCDMIEHLKTSSLSGWPLFMPKVLDSLHHDHAEIRQVAAYAINHASSIPEFAQYVGPAVERMVKVLREEKKFPKKHEDMTKEAVDNMVAALLQICLNQNVAPGTLELVYSKLPLRADTTEGEKVHAQLLKLLKAENPKVLGANNEHFGTLIGKFSEVYGSEGSSDELNMDIRTTFAQIPKEALAQMEKSFSTKQVKKIQRVLKELD